MKILVIEDDRVAAKLFGSWLTKAGYEVETAPDGTSGLEQIGTTQPDAVLLDLLLPGANGWDVLRAIRSTEGFKSLPVVVYTNGYIQEMVGQARAAGATAVLNKATLTSRQLSDAFAALLGLGGSASARRNAA
jgi:two-component system, sensor histidine kinase and response regulator